MKEMKRKKREAETIQWRERKHLIFNGSDCLRIKSIMSMKQKPQSICDVQFASEKKIYRSDPPHRWLQSRFLFHFALAFSL